MLKQGKVSINNALSMPSIVEMYGKKHSFFQQQGLFTFEQDIIRSMDDTPLVKTAYVGHEYLQLLNAPLAMGRLFNENEAVNNKTPVAVISYQAWASIFSKDPQVLDKSLQFGEVDFKIIGVLAENFIEPQIKRKSDLTQVWLPWDFNLASNNMRFAWNGMVREHGMLVKVAPNTDLQKSALELTNYYNARFKEEMADQSFFVNHGIEMRITPLRQAIVGDNKDLAMYMFLGALAVVLIATANIVNLVLSRLVFKQRTMAIHASLGAQRSDIFYDLFIEVFTLMFSASMVSLIVAIGGFEVLKTVSAESLPRLSELTINLQSILFAIGSALVLTLLISALVSRQINYRQLNSLLKSSGKGAGIQISQRVRQTLIVAQVALTGLVLMISIQLLGKAVGHITKPLDFKSENMVELILNTGLKGNQSTVEIQTDVRAIRDELINHPNIISASVAHDFPISSYGALPAFSGWSIHEDKTNRHRSAFIAADENFIDMLGLEYIAGGGYSAEDVVDKNKVVVISDALARKIQADGDLLGKKIFWASSPYQKEPFEVVGIFKSFTLLSEEPLPYVFIARSGSRFPKLLVEYKGEQPPSNAELNQLMAKVSNQYKVAETLTLEKAHEVLVAKDTLTAWLTATLSIFAFALSAVGMYGVLSYNVQIRKYELGIRMAIGARPNTIFIEMLKDNFKPATVGLVLAFVVFALLWRFGSLEEHLVDVSFVAWTLAIIAIVKLTALTTLASVWQIISQRVIMALRGLE